MCQEPESGPDIRPSDPRSSALSLQGTGSFSTHSSPRQYFCNTTWQRLAHVLLPRARARASCFLLQSPQKHSALHPLPASIQGWPEPRPSPGSEVTAQRAPQKIPFALPLAVFALVIALRFLLQRFGSLIHKLCAQLPLQPSWKNKYPLSFRRMKSRVLWGQSSPGSSPGVAILFIHLLNHSTHTYTISTNCAPGTAPGAETQQRTNQRIQLRGASQLLRQ